MWEQEDVPTESSVLCCQDSQVGTRAMLTCVTQDIWTFHSLHTQIKTGQRWLKATSWILADFERTGNVEQ